MTHTLLIHEKCNEDVQSILNSFSRISHNGTDLRKKFLLRLVEVYQNIYENFPGGQKLPINWERPWEEHFVRYIHRVPDFFDVLVIYTKLNSNAIVILGVMSLESYYRVKREQYLAFHKGRFPRTI
jgi:hypothetical protein